MFDQYGRTTGFGQTAPGRDVAKPRTPGQGQPDVASAINGGIVPPSASFRGAQQTIGAPPYAPESGNTGVTGGGFGNTIPEAPQQAPQAPQGLGQFGGKLEGFDGTKLMGDHNSPKYQIGRALSHFDPKQGFTPEVEAALDALGLGDFSGKLGGDKFSVSGNVDPRFKGVTEFDYIRDLENGGGIQFQGLNGEAAPGPGSNPLSSAIMGNFGPGGAQATDIGGGDAVAQLRQQIMQALQVDPVLKQLAGTYGL